MLFRSTTHHVSPINFQHISTKTLVPLPASGTKAPGVKPTKAAVKASASYGLTKEAWHGGLVDWLVGLLVGLLVGCGQGWLIGWLVKVGLISKSLQTGDTFILPIVMFQP